MNRRTQDKQSVKVDLEAWELAAQIGGVVNAQKLSSRDLSPLWPTEAHPTDPGKRIPKTTRQAVVLVALRLLAQQLGIEVR